MDSSASPIGFTARDDGSHDRFGYIAALGERFANSSDFADGLSEAAAGLGPCMNAVAIAIMLLDDKGAGLTCQASFGPIDLRGIKISLADGAIAECLRHNSIIARDYPEPYQFPATDNSFFPVETMLCAPLGIGVLPIGALYILNKHAGAGFDTIDQAFLRAVSVAMSMAIYNSRLSEVIVDQERTRRDLELAADIQRSLLPVSDPANTPVNGINRPARMVSGDFYDYMTLPDGQIPFALGDVSGKGMNAALLMTKTASLFRCLAKSIDDPATLLSIMNGEICETASRGMFVTIVVGVYEPRTGRLRFANAGHEPPLIRNPDRTYQTFPAEAPPIGILPTLDLATVEVNLAGGEFYIFTDGLTEFGYGENEMLGVQGLIQMVEVSTDAPLTTRLDDVLTALDEDGWTARDDLTVLTIDGAWVPGRG